MLPLYKLPFEPDFAKLRAMPYTSFKSDWFGHVPQNAPSFLLACTPTRLLFAGKRKAPPNCDRHQINAFVQELWKKDVIELFLCSDSNSDYQEFNLSPCGAWWSHGFSAPRVPRAHFQRPKGVVCDALCTPESWDVACSIPLAELQITFLLSAASRANICSIIGETQQRFFSWAKLGGSRPDFHLPAKFETLEIKSDGADGG